MHQVVRKAGRPERPLDPGDGPQEAFACELRKLREASGNPTYRAMAGRVHYSASTLARAAAGSSLPHRDLALAYVRACGGDETEWGRRWDAAATQLGLLGLAAGPEPAPPAAEPGPGGRIFRRWYARLAIVVALAALAAGGTVAALHLPGPHHHPAVRRAPAPRPSLAYRDGDDPQITGCAQDVQTQQQVPVYTAPGHRFGTLLLRHSPSCAMSWGAVWGPDPHKYRVYIVASRPADGVRAPSSWALNTPPGSYGNMLSTSRSCVMISAYVHTPTGNGPTAQTRCLR